MWPETDILIAALMSALRAHDFLLLKNLCQVGRVADLLQEIDRAVAAQAHCQAGDVNAKKWHLTLARRWYLSLN